MKEHSRLADRASQWIAKGRTSAFFLRGAGLNDAQAWIDHRSQTAPAPSSEILELILASRLSATRRKFWWAVGPIVALVVGLLSYVTIQFVSIRLMEDADIIAGNIEKAPGEHGHEGMTSMECRLRCMLNRFSRPCLALSYNETQAKCYPKDEADFYKTQSEQGPDADQVNSYIMPRRQDPEKSIYHVDYDRALNGERIGLGDLRLISKEANEYEVNGIPYLEVKRAGECQNLCAKSGGTCKAFNFAKSDAGRCELFRAVKGGLRDSIYNKPVFVPGMWIGCAVASECQ